MGFGAVEVVSGDWLSDRGQLVVTSPAPRVISLAFTGHLEVPLARRITLSVDQLLNAGHRPHVFNDWEHMSGYDSPARVLLTEWALRQRTHFASVHLLLGSRLVAMGVSVANLAIGGIINPYMDRAAWERTLLRHSAQAAPLAATR